MTPKAEIFVKSQYGRGIIKSGANFAYENAQKFINHPVDPIDQLAFSEVTDGWTLENVKECVLELSTIASDSIAYNYHVTCPKFLNSCSKTATNTTFRILSNVF